MVFGASLIPQMAQPLLLEGLIVMFDYGTLKQEDSSNHFVAIHRTSDKLSSALMVGY